MAVGMGITLIGLGRIFSNFDKALENAKVGTVLGLNKHADVTLEGSLPQTPFDTGALFESGEVTEADKKTLAAWVSFGRDDIVNEKTGKPTSEYAVAVHEVQANYRVGNYKFLANSFNENMDDAPRTIGDEVAARLGKGLR